MSTNFNIRLSLTLSKIMGALTMIAGLYGFISGKDATQSVALVGIGAAAIGIKQFFNSKVNATKD